MIPGPNAAPPPPRARDSRSELLARILAVAAALAVESKTAWEFLGAPGGAAPPLPILLLHFAASAMFALAFLPAQGQSANRRSFLIFAFVFAFSLPCWACSASRWERSRPYPGNRSRRAGRMESSATIACGFPSPLIPAPRTGRIPRPPAGPRHPRDATPGRPAGAPPPLQPSREPPAQGNAARSRR